MTAASTFPGEEDATEDNSSITISNASSLRFKKAFSASSIFVKINSNIAAWFARQRIANVQRVL